MEFKYKQVIVVRADLKLSIGKTSVQVAHASVTAAEDARKSRRKWWKTWISEGQRKIAVKVDSLEELLVLEDKAKALNIPNALITDKGLTEVPPGTTTALGIGPAPNDIVDRVTRDLPLI
ncbi:MAG: peptidyl-tRNA hydrolase Pth2 [Candidatus Hodarchaeota archaeon]